jgi:transmembrane sensor
MGEQRVIQLDDASTLTLNTNSHVSVSYAEDLRQLELLAGEAFFEVTPDAERPFSVDAGSARVTVLGTAFNIERNGDITEVTVTEGVVQVTEVLGDSPAPSSSVLRANQRLAATPEGLGELEAVEDDRDTAWLRGELVAYGMSLPALATELERYSDTRILFGDADVASLSVSGVFRLDDPEATIAAVALSLDLDVKSVDEDTVLLLKAPR